MKNLLLSLLVAPVFALAQSPSPSPRPTPRPIIGYIAGIERSGTSVWSKPVQIVPVFYGRRNPVFISGTTAPTLAGVQLAVAQRATIAALAQSYSVALAGGITVTSGSVTMTLPARPSDQQQFTGLLTLLNTAPMPPTLTIADIHGNPQTVTVGQYYTLIGSYGQQIAGMWGALETARSSVAAVTGTAGLAKITLADPTGQ